MVEVGGYALFPRSDDIRRIGPISSVRNSSCARSNISTSAQLELLYMDNAEIPSIAKHPILMDPIYPIYKPPLTTLIVRDAHTRVKHMLDSGVSITNNQGCQWRFIYRIYRIHQYRVLGYRWNLCIIQSSPTSQESSIIGKCCSHVTNFGLCSRVACISLTQQPLGLLT